MSAASLELRPAAGTDEATLGAFARALPSDDPARAVLTSWGRYAASHATGLRVWVAASGADAHGPARIAALVAARGVPARIDGQERVFAEVVAASAHPADRGTARAPRLVAELTRRYLDAHNTLERDVVTYGFAADAAWRTLKHGLEVEVLRRQPELVAAVDASGPSEPDASGGVREVLAFDDRALALYERCAAAWRASARRDAATLGWRFGDGSACHRLVVEDGDGAWAGLAVAAPRADGRLELADWLVPEGDAPAGEALDDALLRLARRLGCPAVRASLPPWCGDFQRFQARGFRVRAAEGFVLARSAHAKLDVWWLREHWWFQPFDVARPGA